MRQSKPNFDIKPIGHQTVAVIIAEWNRDYNQAMLDSFTTALESVDCTLDIYEVPGAFEMPIMALKLTQSKKYDAIVCFGTIIKGDTLHFEIVANESARGIMNVMLETGVPIINGILACNTTEQAELRASQQKEDKGREIALTLIGLLNSFHKIHELQK